ncbi:PREDICTED: uncharacterized protein LOC108548437 [Eufriesea mexicana]|uniref:uncharacterized protein LOC108548437 n=1 Tax=Eufriesea mexicana TaxID=516756 RepID=UPI00083BB56B|nr:PREDICTED: uncharacterized protein LOC108548437 [Eufriesea mexicana]
MFNPNIRQVFYILELIGTVTCTWPTDPKSSKKAIVIRNFQWLITILDLIFMLVVLILGIFHSQNDITNLMQTACDFFVLMKVMFDLILCKKNYVQLQLLIGEIKAFIDVASDNEFQIIQRYMDRYKFFFSMTGMGYMLAGISFCVAPLFSSQELPAGGWIPFSIQSLGVYCTVYAIEVYWIFQTVLCIGVDFTVAILLSFPAAKLDILGTKLQHVTGYDMLVSCVKEHQEIIRFVDDTSAALRALLFKANVTVGCAVICGTIPLIYMQSVGVVCQYLPVVVSGCAQLFIFSWPADDLRESSLRFAKSLNDVQWLGKPRKMKSAVIVMMQRSQKTLLMTMSGFLPPLSLEYFASVLIAKLKVFLDEASENERTVIQGYIDRYKVYFSVTGMSYMFGAASFCFVPFFTGQELPADGWIPFSIESYGIFCTIYVVEAYCVLQTGFSIFVDFMIAILFSFSAAKLDILGMKLRHVKSYDMLVSCIKEYQEIIRYVEDIKVTVEFLLIKTNATMACAVVSGAMPLIYNQSLSVISQFLPMVLSGCLHLFVISWPADDLRESSIRFAKSISDIHWLGEPRKTKSTVVIMMIRSQKAFLVTMGGVLPPLSLEYYARFLSTLSSYIMGMRTMIET